jgi:glycosyltransferase involved in cell wall biosynthesis
VPDEVPIFLFSGGLRPHRGIEKTILALRSLQTGVLVILGEGPLREDLEQLVNDHGVKSRVFFTDFVAHDEVPSLIRSADVGVIPYEHVGTNHYLASPSKLFHYVMAELPIACSDFPFLRAVVVEHELGDVFDPGDPASIAGTLGAMVDDPRRYARYKANLARLKRRYSWEEEEKRFMENYRAVDPGVADERRA